MSSRFQLGRHNSRQRGDFDEFDQVESKYKPLKTKSTNLPTEQKDAIPFYDVTVNDTKPMPLKKTK